MRVKLDENLGTRAQKLLRDRGFDVATVVSQGLAGTSDDELVAVCRAESRVLITLDRDFSNILRYPPERFSGIVVLRLPGPLTLESIAHALERVARAAEVEDPTGRLWIADATQIRVFEPSGADS